MKFKLSNGNIHDTLELENKALSNSSIIEECARINIKDTYKYPIGFVIPLGTLGNAPSKELQFKSNFHIVAYTVSSDLLEREVDFEDFNISDNKSEQGHIISLSRKLDALASNKLGSNWRITVFNVKLSSVIDSMSKCGASSANIHKTIDEFYSIIESRLSALEASIGKKGWTHDLVELFYAPVPALSFEVTKIIEKGSQDKHHPNGLCSNIAIETLVYDDYANGIRLLTNIESFASSKIRLHQSDNKVYPFVLKARVSGESIEFRPVRQFGGKSLISACDTASGCVERVIYNLVNKHYKHWSFISIPSDLSFTLYQAHQ